MPPPDLPVIMKPSEWTKHKGRIAKIFQKKTHVTEALTRLMEAWARTLRHLTVITVVPTAADLQKLDDAVIALEEVARVARAAETSFREHKLIPKESTEYVRKLAADAESSSAEVKTFRKEVETVIADNKTFKQDPKKFIEANRCTLAPLPSGDVAKAFERKVVAKDLHHFKEKSETMTAIVRQDQDRPLEVKQIVPVVAKGPCVTFLPWDADLCTYTQLSAKAMYCFTGPLQGCNIYVATHASKEPLFLHTNANQDKDDIPKNVAAKDAMAKRALAEKDFQGYTFKQRLARATYKVPAFVFGERKGKGWEFFVHAHDGGKVVDKARALAAWAG